MFKEQLGTSGFTILLPDISSHDDEAFVLTNHTAPPGAPEDIDAELGGGLYGIVRTTLDLSCTAFQITEGALTVRCDCVSALHSNITSKTTASRPTICNPTTTAHIPSQTYHGNMKQAVFRLKDEIGNVRNRYRHSNTKKAVLGLKDKIGNVRNGKFRVVT